MSCKLCISSFSCLRGNYTPFPFDRIHLTLLTRVRDRCETSLISVRDSSLLLSSATTLALRIMSDAPTTIKINIKGPSDVKLTLDVDTSSTVKELKEQIEQQNGEFKADQQRLIYSGRILKDDDQISKFSIKDGNTVHLVRSSEHDALESLLSADASSSSLGQGSSSRWSFRCTGHFGGCRSPIHVWCWPGRHGQPSRTPHERHQRWRSG